MEHKFVELLSANFAPVPEEHVRKQLDFRYRAVKSRLAIVQACLADVYAVVGFPFPAQDCGHRAQYPQWPGRFLHVGRVQESVAVEKWCLICLISLVSDGSAPMLAIRPWREAFSSLHCLSVMIACMGKGHERACKLS